MSVTLARTNKKPPKKRASAERYLKLLSDCDVRSHTNRQPIWHGSPGKTKVGDPSPVLKKKRSSTDAKVPSLRYQQSAYNLRQIGARRAKKILLLVGILSIFGVIMIFAASAVTSTIGGKSPFSLALRQVIWILCGGVGYFFSSRISLQKVRDLSKPLLALAAGLLFIVLLPGVSKYSGGASRWIGIGPFEMQPSEFAKLAFAIFVADLIAKRERSKHYVKDLVFPVASMAVILGIMVMRQPDLGTTIIIVGIGLIELGVSHLPKKIFATTLATSAVVVMILSVIEPYRFDRLLAFLNPSANARGSGYQLIQSQLALGQGHIIGAGLASSPMAWGLLPNAQTDFIFSVVGNDMGIVGTMAILTAFTVLFILGIKIALAAKDVFSSYLAIGLVVLVCGQAFLNIAGVIGILPETGIPLPFFSAGGSSLIVVLAACGLLVNISRHPLVVTTPKKSRFGATGTKYAYLSQERRVSKRTDVALYYEDNGNVSHARPLLSQEKKRLQEPYSNRSSGSKYHP